MKINYDSFPIIRAIESKDASIAKLPTVEGYKYQLDVSFFPKYLGQIFKNSIPVHYMTEIFYKTCTDKKVMARLSHLIKMVPDKMGCLLIDGISYIYEVKNDFKGNIEIIIFFFYKESFLGFNAQTWNIDPSDDDRVNVKESVNNFWYDKVSNPENVVWFFMMYLLFTEYAETKVKICQKKAGVEAFNCKYSNSTNKNIHILNSTWYTTLIKSEGFNVRGHFRLQPYKTGKKLIWINDFEKHGYTRKAGILKDQE